MAKKTAAAIKTNERIVLDGELIRERKSNWIGFRIDARDLRILEEATTKASIGFSEFLRWALREKAERMGVR